MLVCPLAIETEYALEHLQANKRRVHAVITICNNILNKTHNC